MSKFTDRLCPRFLAGLLSLYFLLAVPSHGAFASKDGSVATLPIQMVNHRVYIKADVSDGRSLLMLVDTGATASVIFTDQDFLDPARLAQEVSLLGEAPNLATTEKENTAIIFNENIKKVTFPALQLEALGEVQKDISITVGGRKLANDLILNIHRSIRSRVETDIIFDGIIGHGLYDNYIVEINPHKKYMKLWPHGTNLQGRFKSDHPISLDESRPVVQLKMSLPWEKRSSNRSLLLDSGYPGSMVLWKNEPLIEGLKRIDVSHEEGLNYALIMNFAFAGTRIRRAPVYFLDRATHPDGRNYDGLIGMAFFTLFHHAVDTKSQTLYLKPQKSARFIDNKRLSSMLQLAPNLGPYKVIYISPEMEDCMHKTCVGKNYSLLTITLNR